MQKSRIQDLVIGLITIALGGFLWTYTNGPNVSDANKLFSRFVLALFIGLGAILCVISLINAKKPGGKEVAVREFKNPLIMYALILVYVFLMNTIGFFVASAIFMPAVMFYMGYRKPIPMVCVTFGMLAFVWLLFVVELKVSLPDGLLF